MSGRRDRARTPLLRAATLGLVPLGLLGGYLAGRALRAAPPVPLGPALDGAVETLDLPFGRLAIYRDGSRDAAPLLLVHSVNAAASAYETKPLYDHYARTRAVYAVDLPGFGLSERPERIYTPRLMTDAILALVEEIRRRHGPYPVDAVAISTASEFLARAASERPTLFRTLALISPTGFRSDRPGDAAPGATHARPALRDLPVLSGLVAHPLPRPRQPREPALLPRQGLGIVRPSTRGFSPMIIAVHTRPGAQHAPLSFVAGFLFSADILSVYKALTVPVWIGHGTRGGFVRYGRLRELEDRSNWTIRAFDTGAMIHFEQTAAFLRAYGAFLDRVA